jgi:hypothetical protein
LLSGGERLRGLAMKPRNAVHISKAFGNIS